VTDPEMDPKVDCADSGEPRSMAARHREIPKASAARIRTHDLFMRISPPPREAH
jgi:hypothetical protein